MAWGGGGGWPPWYEHSMSCWGPGCHTASRRVSMQVVKHVLDMYEIHFLKDPLEGGVGSI